MRLNLAVGALALLVGAGLWIFARNAPRCAFMQLLMALSAVTLSVMVANARTTGG